MRSLFPLVLCFAAAVPLACSGSGRDRAGADAPDGSAAAGPNGGPTSDPDIAVQTGQDGGPPVGGCVKDSANFDAPGDNCDNDNDGTIDNVAPACDAALTAAGTAEQFAKALGLCQRASGPSDPKWGVISASYRRGHNDTEEPAEGQHGILKSFGPNVKAREGDAFGVLSTGWAREYDDETNKTAPFKKGGAMQPTSLLSLFSFGPKAPPGFPKSSANCPAIPIAQDIAVVHLQIKVPNNAQGLAFDFNFYSGEWPEYLCSRFNDSFVAYLKSSAFNNGQADNISFDAKGSPVSINNAFFDRCTNGVQTGCKGSSVATSSCSGGESELEGTGFKEPGNYCNAPSAGGGATGWLTSQAPVKPGETIELEFYIWDGTDPTYNSSVLLDNFKWVPTPVAAETTRPK